MGSQSSWPCVQCLSYLVADSVFLVVWILAVLVPPQLFAQQTTDSASLRAILVDFTSGPGRQLSVIWGGRTMSDMSGQQVSVILAKRTSHLSGGQNPLAYATV